MLVLFKVQAYNTPMLTYTPIPLMLALKRTKRPKSCLARQS